MIAIESLTIRGILSFGWEPVTLGLEAARLGVQPENVPALMPLPEPALEGERLVNGVDVTRLEIGEGGGGGVAQSCASGSRSFQHWGQRFRLTHSA